MNKEEGKTAEKGKNDFKKRKKSESKVTFSNSKLIDDENSNNKGKNMKISFNKSKVNIDIEKCIKSPVTENTVLLSEDRTTLNNFNDRPKTLETVL